VPTRLPTDLPGDKVRKAIDEFCEILKSNTELSKGEIINTVSKKFDLSPLEGEFLRRQLMNH
jgi:hypothetical protein